MKGQKLISILSVLLVVPLFAQQNQIQQLERAEQTIAAADSSFDQNQAEVLDSVDKAEVPELPEEPVFEVPSDQVFLDLLCIELYVALALNQESLLVLQYVYRDILVDYQNQMLRSQ